MSTQTPETPLSEESEEFDFSVKVSQDEIEDVVELIHKLLTNPLIGKPKNKAIKEGFKRALEILAAEIVDQKDLGTFKYGTQSAAIASLAIDFLVSGFDYKRFVEDYKIS